MAQITKEELQKENAILKERLAEAQKTEEDMRHTFTTILKGPVSDGPYPGLRERREDLSWMEICTEIGKLLAARTFYDLEGNVSEIETTLERIPELIKKIIKHENTRDKCACEEC